MPTFEDLRIWQDAHQLMKEIHELCRSLPRQEMFRLRDQIERSSLAVCDNIAEGYTAYYYNDKIKGMYTARKEAGETQNHLRSLEAKAYINKEVADGKIKRYQSVIKGINGYVRYIADKREMNKHKCP
jgi:four helix bundle protein